MSVCQSLCLPSRERHHQHTVRPSGECITISCYSRSAASAAPARDVKVSSVCLLVDSFPFGDLLCTMSDHDCRSMERSLIETFHYLHYLSNGRLKVQAETILSSGAMHKHALVMLPLGSHRCPHDEPSPSMLPMFHRYTWGNLAGNKRIIMAIVYVPF